MDLYAENILDHYRHPRNVQRLLSPTVSHEEVNASCGDRLTIDLELKGDVIAKIGWNGTGCAISQAAMSMLSEEIQESKMRNARPAEPVGRAKCAMLNPRDIYEQLGVPIGPRRVKCALLCLHALKNALRKAEGKTPQGWTETLKSL
jgi:nitrogen fixation NifU-like protein